MQKNISVIMLAYNAEDFLEEAVLSVANQSLPPKEIIICDDCSKDSTQELVLKLQKKFPNLIRPFLNKKNLGVAKNINQGLKNATGDYACFIAGDDTWEKHKLEYEYEAITRDNADIAYSRSNLIDINGKYLSKFDRQYDGHSGYVLGQMLTHQMSFRNFLFKTELLQKVGFLDENLYMFEDWDFKIRLLEIGKVAFVDKYTVNYRKTGTGLSSSGSVQYRKALTYIYDKHDGLINSQGEDWKQIIIEQRDAAFRRLEVKEFLNSSVINKVLNFPRTFLKNPKELLKLGGIYYLKKIGLFKK